MTFDNRPMRVLFVNHGAIIGGAETNLLNILKYAPEGGFEPVGVLVPHDGPLVAEVRKLGIDVGQISYHAFHWRNPFRYTQTLAQLVIWIRRTRPAVIHLNHQWLISHIVQAGIITRTPVVCHTRNYLDESFVHSQRRWLGRAQAIVVESKAVKQRSQELQLPEDRLKLIYNGADVDRFYHAKSAANLSSRNQNRTGPIVGFSGRIVPEKGPEDLIMAIPLVLREVPSARFCIVGEDQDKGLFVKHLKSIAAELDVKQSVEFLGFRSDVEKLLRDFDVLAIPSRTSMSEGLPLTALEGLAAGCLVVATPNSGIPEVILHNETGFLVTSDDPESLAQGVIRALTLPDFAAEGLRQAGQDLVMRRFTIQRQVIELGQLFRENAL